VEMTVILPTVSKLVKNILKLRDVETERRRKWAGLKTNVVLRCSHLDSSVSVL